MGSLVEVGRIQGGRQTLTDASLAVASVVPDVTGIDKVFDYAVPDSIRSLRVGDRVRVDLNGRRVGGWVVALSEGEHLVFDSAKLRPIVARSGVGVDPDVVDLCRWVADHWCGPLRAVLATASAPRIRAGVSNARYGSISTTTNDPVAAAVEDVRTRGGGLVRVPPASSALAAVVSAVVHGPVLVVCPTQRMARLGAAALRRRGLGVALLPDDWAVGSAGADVVIGARSAVFAPCLGMATIVVIDEHDEALKEERSPSWDATSVAVERARRAGVPIVCTSPVPSAESHMRWNGRFGVVSSAKKWPTVTVEDLSELSVSGSLLGRALLSAARDGSAVTLAVLNTKGRSKLVVCSSCASTQRCHDCRALLEETEDGMRCGRCRTTGPSVCVACGRTAFRSLKAGTAGLCTQIERSTGTRPVEVTAETPLEALAGGLFVGTEAVLRRVDHADTVIFCDIDRDLGAPRITAPREVLADVARAARVVGARGSVVIQTRDVSHPVVVALTSPDPDAAVAEYLAGDVATREALGLPPFSTLVTISATRPLALVDAPALEGVDWSVDRESLVARVGSPPDVTAVVDAIAESTGLKVRAHVAPARH